MIQLMGRKGVAINEVPRTFASYYLIINLIQLYHRKHQTITNEIKIEKENKTCEYFLELNTKLMWMDLEFLHFIVCM